MTRNDLEMVRRLLWLATVVQMRHHRALAMMVVAALSHDGRAQAAMADVSDRYMGMAEAEFRSAGGRSVAAGDGAMDGA